MATVTIQEAQARLAELVEDLAPGDQVVITRDDRPVARLVGAAPAELPATAVPRLRRLGTLEGTVTYIAPDFDAPLDDFAEYMP
jgi:prevent-host-death family protein